MIGSFFGAALGNAALIAFLLLFLGAWF